MRHRAYGTIGVASGHRFFQRSPTMARRSTYGVSQGLSIDPAPACTARGYARSTSGT